MLARLSASERRTACVGEHFCTVEEAEKLLVTWLNRPGTGEGGGAGGGSMLHK